MLCRAALLVLLLAAPVLAAPTAAALTASAKIHATETFVLLVACEDYHAHLCALRDHPGTTQVSAEVAAALPALIAARERELVVVRTVADALRGGDASALDRADAQVRDWLGAVLESGPTALFDGWQIEGAARGRAVGSVVDDIVIGVAERIRPRQRAPLFPLVIALAAGAGGALALRRRRAPPPVTAAAAPTLAGDRTTLALAERYDGLVTLGAGGMGMVMRGRDRVLQRDVAIKIPHSSVALQPDVLARFLREAQALASLSHPSIVRILDVHALAPVYYTMELIDGGTLHTRMAGQQRWTAVEALAVMAPVADALAACHRAALVHRDVKPANILLDRAGAVRLSDFGLAFLEGGTRLTLTDQIVGTPAYLAPEVLEGGRPTPACDVHAWGLVLYDLLTGDADARERKLSARLTTDLAPLARFRADLDPALAALVMDCVARAPAARPADGDALVARLEAITARRDGPQLAYAAAAGRLETLVAAELHTLKNRAAQVDPAALDAVRAGFVAVGALEGVPTALAETARALARELAPATVGDVHRRACALLAELALPLRPALEEVVRGYGRRARLIVDLPPPPVHVLDRAGAVRDLKLCVTNWIDNALEADAARVDVILGAEGASALVRVTNDGAPFPPESRAHVFREPIALRGEGRGTGLITVARTVRARGWSVSLEDGELTTFRLTIPA